MASAILAVVAAFIGGVVSGVSTYFVTRSNNASRLDEIDKQNAHDRTVREDEFSRERRTDLTNRRIELVRLWREGLAVVMGEIVVTEWRGEDADDRTVSIVGQVWFESLRPHLIVDPTDGSVYAQADSEMINALISEVADIERRWGLV